MLNKSIGFPDELERHRGMFTADDVAKIQGSTVAIAGVGGVGGRLAEVLARSGVGTIRIADPDTFAASNLNRQAGSTLANLGQLKVDVVGDLCQSVSRKITVEKYPEGINADNVEKFVSGADVVVDGTDYTIPSLGLMLARTAASASIPVALGVEVGFASWQTVITGTGTFERFFGMKPTVSLSDLDSGAAEVPLWRWIGRLPRHIPMTTVQAVSDGSIEAPALASAVELSAALLSTNVLRLLLGQEPSVSAPRIQFVDLVAGKTKTFRPNYFRFVRSAILRR